MAAVAVGVYLALPSEREQPLLELDIRAGEPLGDAMARSSLTHGVRIALGMQKLYLPTLDRWNGERYQVRLRGADGASALIPWTPASGVIWMETGLIDEIDLEFLNFHRTRADDDGWVVPAKTYGDPPGTLEEEIDAIAAIYEAVHSLGLQPAERVNCYRNSLEPNRRPCERVTLATDRLAPDALRGAVRSFHAGFLHEMDNDPEAREKVVPVLNLGQWWLSDGRLVMMKVVPYRNVELGEDPGRRPYGLSMSLNVKAYFHAGLARLIPVCHDQQAIFPDKVRYTQAQAAQIFHGLYDDFHPPSLDGRVVNDPVEQAQLQWDRLRDRYYNDPDTRRGFCELQRELVQAAGYDGPAAWR